MKQEYSDTSHKNHAGKPTTHKSVLKSQSAGNKQPLYDEMTNEQWVQGMLLCILEETNAEIRSQMLSHFAIIMQDTIGLSLGTARRTHTAVLQEMEKRKLSWEDSDQVEK